MIRLGRPWLLAIPMLGAALAYANTLRCDFILDDVNSVVRDPAALDLTSSTRALLPALLSAGRGLAEETFAGQHLGKFSSPGIEGGRSFTAWTFALNHALSGSTSFGYHATNLAIHLGVVVLVFFFTRALLARALASAPTACALVVAGVFALHPLNSQAVNYITQRSELIASAAYLGCLLLLMRGETARRWASGALLLCALVVFVVGLGAKVILVTMPLAYWMILYVIPDRQSKAKRASWLHHLGRTTPFLALAVWKTLALVHSVEGHADAGFSVSVPGLTPWTYFMTEWKVMLVYVRLVFWPAGQCLDWLYPVATRPDAFVVAAGLVLSVAVTAAVLLARRARSLTGDAAPLARLLAFGVLWFLIVLSTTSTLMPIADLLVEHRMYLASLGIFIAVVVAFEERTRAWLDRRSIWSRGGIVVLLWAALGGALYRRNTVWTEPIAVWRDVVAKRPGNGRAHGAIATIKQAQGDLVGAIQEYGLALDLLGKDRINDRLITIRGLAAALVDVGRSAEAFLVLRQGLAEKPGDPTTLATLAAAELRAGDSKQAEQDAEEVLSQYPSHSQALLTLGEIRLISGDMAGAARFLAMAVAVEPSEPVRLLEYGQALSGIGQRDGACQAWRRAEASPAALEIDKRQATEYSIRAGCSAVIAR